MSHWRSILAWEEVKEFDTVQEWMEAGLPDVPIGTRMFDTRSLCSWEVIAMVPDPVLRQVLIDGSGHPGICYVWENHDWTSHLLSDILRGGVQSSLWEEVPDELHVGDRVKILSKSVGHNLEDQRIEVGEVGTIKTLLVAGLADWRDCVTLMCEIPGLRLPAAHSDIYTVAFSDMREAFFLAKDLSLV